MRRAAAWGAVLVAVGVALFAVIDELPVSDLVKEKLRRALLWPILAGVALLASVAAVAGLVASVPWWIFAGVAALAFSATGGLRVALNVLGLPELGPGPWLSASIGRLVWGEGEGAGAGSSSSSSDGTEGAGESDDVMSPIYLELIYGTNGKG